MSLSHDSNEGVSDSQGSHISDLSLDLSQDTVNQLLGAVGMSGSDGSQFTTQFESWIDDINEEEEVPGTSTISISRAIISASSVQGQCSLGPSQLADADSYLQAPPLQPYPWVSPVQTHCQPSPESSSTRPSPFITPTGHGRSELMSPFSENDSTTPSPPPLQITTTPPLVSFCNHAPPTAPSCPLSPPFRLQSLSEQTSHRTTLISLAGALWTFVSAPLLGGTKARTRGRQLELAASRLLGAGHFGVTGREFAEPVTGLRSVGGDNCLPLATCRACH